MCGQGFLLLIGINVFGHDDLTAKYCYFKRSKPPDVDEIQSQSQGQLICRGQAEKLQLTDMPWYNILANSIYGVWVYIAI